MSLLHGTDVYQGPEEKAARKHPEYGFALALICVVLALVVASVAFPDAFIPSGEFYLSVLKSDQGNATNSKAVGGVVCLAALPCLYRQSAKASKATAGSA